MYKGKVFLNFGEELEEEKVHKLMSMLDKTMDAFVDTVGEDGTVIVDYGTYLTKSMEIKDGLK